MKFLTSEGRSPLPKLVRSNFGGGVITKRNNYKLPPQVRILFGVLLAQVESKDLLLELFDIVGNDYNRIAELEAENERTKTERDEYFDRLIEIRQKNARLEAENERLKL